MATQIICSYIGCVRQGEVFGYKPEVYSRNYRPNALPLQIKIICVNPR
jgi:hypothetical protein